MKSKYGYMYVPIAEMENITHNSTYKYDYNHDTIFETKLNSELCNFNILHYHKDCNCSPENVTYILFCPYCSPYGQTPVTASYIHTDFKKIRFYLNHSRHMCPIIREKKCRLKANLFCDQCVEPIYKNIYI